MKFLKIAMAAALALGFGNAYAFHSGGVAECEGCHTMHNGQDAQGLLLVGGDQSSACLTCHEHAGDTGPSSYHISTPGAEMDGVATGPKQRTPGGDFGWLRLTFSNSYVTVPGAQHGHSIVAADNGYAYERAAPGGTFNDPTFGCHSCHDPHGKYRRTTDDPGIDGSGYSTGGAAIQKSGSYNTSTLPVGGGAVGAYRILAGVNYKPLSTTKNGATAPAFLNPPPNASAPSSYNRTEQTTQTTVAYGSGMSEWCANCHPNFLNTTHEMGDLVHPAGNNATLAGVLYVGDAYGGSQTLFQNYNNYVKSGDMSGTPGSDTDLGDYTSLVPFEQHTSDFTALRARSGLGKAIAPAADANSNVMCLSCHRAHASGFIHMLRYDYGNEFVTVNDGAGNAVYPDPTTRPGQGMTPAIRQAAYYDRAPTQFAVQQRVFCNKCHAKD